MTITDLKVSVILSHSGHKNGKRKKVTDRKSVGKKAITNPVREKRKQSLTAEGESQWPTAGARKSLTYRMQGKIDH